MRIDYVDLLDGRRDKDIEEPFQSSGPEKLVKFKPRKKIFKTLVKVAEDLDYTVYVGNPPYPHILPIDKKLIMPTLKRCRWNSVLFFSIFVHELSHIIPYETRFGLYSKYEEEIICEFSAIMCLEKVSLVFFNEKRYKETRDRLIGESLQYIKRWINRANKSTNQENHINKKRLSQLVAISKKRYNYLLNSLMWFDKDAAE